MKKKADKSLIEKIQKLFALGQSPNENEAAAAIKKAEALMAEYDLSIGEVNYIKEKEERKGGKKIYEWELYLFAAVCVCNNCVPASNRSRAYGRFSLAGREINVFLSLEMFRYLMDAIARAAKNECKGKGRKYAFDFKMAAAERIAEKLYEYGDRVSWAVDREKELKAITEFTKNKVSKKEVGAGYSFECVEAVRAGIKAGDNIGLHKQAGIENTILIGA